MCNEVHRDQNFIEIPEHGFGLKMFSPTAELSSIINRARYEVESDGWISWNPEYEMFLPEQDVERGFCFFYSQDIKEICSEIFWQFSIPLTIRHIEYRGGIGEFDEHLLCKGTHRTAICKKFRICEFV